jgi:GT2 family glycosyltransferase
MPDSAAPPPHRVGPVRQAWRRLAARYPNGARRLRRRIGKVTEYGRLPFARWQAPNPLFDAEWYLEHNPDVKASGMDAYRHFRLFGAYENRDPNELFDTSWYLLRYPDVRASGRNPLDHYLVHGWREGRDPGPLFSTRWYLKQYPSVKLAGINPLVDYLRTGRALGRKTAPAGRGGGPGRGRAAPGRDGAARADARDPPSLRATSRLLPAVLSNSTSAIANLEAMRADGVESVAVSPVRFRLPALGRHLARYPVLGVDHEGWTIHDLRAPRTDPLGSLEHALATVVDAMAWRTDRVPSILSWGVDLDLSVLGPGSQPFAAPGWVEGRLPYLERSIDVVVIRDPDPTLHQEAVRVADVAVLVLRGEAERTTVEAIWRPGGLASPAPSVSVVIPTFNGGGLVSACLRALWETIPPGARVDAIVIDDGSAPEARRALEVVCRHERVRLLRNEHNAGFLASVTRGAHEASGEYLLFLNDDTIPLPGWLPPLLRTFRDRPEAGAVGGRMVYPNGRLMEAGGIVYRDGSGANYGRGDPNPEAPHYSYLREVDYVSGAMLMTPRRLFLDLGGFDPSYGFGYYEDTDYCFRLREAGRRVYYQPASTIVHREGASAGTDPSAGAKRYQARNRPIFVERWQARLDAQPTAP